MDFETIQRHLSYDPDTGKFERLISVAPLAKAGGKVGRETKRGRTQIMVCGKLYMANRLAWRFIHGVWPDKDVCHKNGDLTDVRAENLYEATHSQAGHGATLSKSNSSGVRGVSFNKSFGQWQVYITVSRKRIWVGRSHDKDIAAQMRRDAEKRYAPNAY